MLDIIINYFLQDPMKAFYLIGGSGGIYYWVNQWRFRTRLQVKIINETYDLQPDYMIVNLKAECINLGNMATSLEPVVTVKAFCPKQSKRIFSLNVTSPDRTLAPHEPKIIEYSGRCEHVFPFTFYRRYKFKITRGSACNKYVLNASKTEISWLKYQWGKVLFRFFKIVPA